MMQQPTGRPFARALRRAAAASWLLASVARADQAPISIDGDLADWGSVAPALVDPAGDGGASGVDFGRLALADDDRFLFIRVETGAEFDLAENNDLVLYLDTDADETTGLAVAGIGAELQWHFGLRTGTFFHAGGSATVGHADLRFRAGPTTTATEFEMALGLSALPDGSHPLFLGSTVRLLLRDEAPGGDQVPDDPTTLLYALGAGTLPPETPVPIDRLQSSDLRLASWNTKNDSLWSPGQQDRFRRQIVAVDPVIISFQEIYDHTADETRQLIAQWLPGQPGESWFAAGVADCKTISRFAVLGAWPLDGNLAVLLDTATALGGEMLLINAHLPCCSNDAGRQAEIDRIMAFIRDAEQPGGILDLAPGTPIVLTGDLNLVGSSQQLLSLHTGDIVNEGVFGPDFTPDWDGSDLADILPRQTELRMGYTWRNDFSSFWPGRLDFVIFTDSALAAANRFVLYTPEMSATVLAKHGLLADDSLASDHLLFCADFRPPGTPADLNGDGVVDVIDLLILLGDWGACPPPPDACPGDLDQDGSVDVLDLLDLLAHWG